MKPINIYALTRISDAHRLERLERQMSGRPGFLKIKSWEIEGLKAFAAHLGSVADNAPGLDFYYSFTLPKLGKEFDLLRINESIVVNIELKSGNVTDDTIKRQLLQNRHYLAMLGRSIYSYTFVSETERLLRLSNAGRLVDAGWEELSAVLGKQGDCFDGEIEELFKEDRFLISPLTDPGRFLRQEYFLTAQQNDIKNQILKQIKKSRTEGGLFTAQGFTGLPGTGKTLLLYDLAMQLSRHDRVCVIHPGLHTGELEQLDERLKRIDFYCGDIEKAEFKYAYTALLVDEGHRLTLGMLQRILALSEEWRAPVIFSYDAEEPVALPERKLHGAEMIEALPGFVKHKLTNRIRLNKELSSFITCTMCVKGKGFRSDYPNVSLAYAGNEAEAEALLKGFTEQGYIFIRDESVYGGSSEKRGGEIEAQDTDCKEFDKIVMLADDSFYYDEGGYLRSNDERPDDARVTNLFHGLNRAKHKIAVIVKDNLELFDRLLGVLQRK